MNEMFNRLILTIKYRLSQLFSIGLPQGWFTECSLHPWP